MRRSTPLAVFTGLLLFVLTGCGNSSGDSEGTSVACDSLCERLDECGVDFSADSSASEDPDFTEFECSKICDDISKLEPEVAGSCRRATTAMLECSESLTCGILDDMDFLIVGKVMTLNPAFYPPTFGDDDLPSSFPIDYWNSDWIPSVQVPAVILFDLSCRGDPRRDEAQECSIDPRCMVNPSEVNAGIFNQLNICRVDRFDVLTLYVTGLDPSFPCVDEYLDMVRTCEDAIHF